MTKIRVVIADDEPLARRGIRQLLAMHCDIIVVAEAKNGLEAVRAVRASQPNLLFLDVQMPELDGFDVLDEIGAEHMPAVIFVTAYDEFAVRAFDAHALDYLVKPPEEARFKEALERTRERLRSAEAIEQSRRLSELLKTQRRSTTNQRLLVPTPTGDLVLDASEIDWIEADDYYAAVHALGRRHLIRESLSSLERRLSQQRFVRTHRSAIVNIYRVRELRLMPSGETVLLLGNGTQVPVSRRRREQVTQRLRKMNELL